VIAKAERVDMTQLELEFAATLAELDKLAGLVKPETDSTGGEGGAAVCTRRSAKSGSRSRIRSTRASSSASAPKRKPPGSSGDAAAWSGW
jgi:hypothetical protein